MRLQTLLKGRCTDDVEVQSDWVYGTFQIPPQGQGQPNWWCLVHFLLCLSLLHEPVLAWVFLDELLQGLLLFKTLQSSSAAKGCGGA